MNILAIDTSTEACSAALLCDDGRVFTEFEIAPRQHTRLLPKMMDAVLSSAGCAKSDLTHCAFANGPGAFTGIRIAASTAQGIGIALGIPLIAVSSLATLAQSSIDRKNVGPTLVALDARMSEVYWAVYDCDDKGLAQLSGSEKLDKIADVTVPIDIKHGAGHGWTVGRDIWQLPNTISIEERCFPDANALLKLASRAVEQNQTGTASNITINYLRNRVAEKSRKA